MRAWKANASSANDAGSGTASIERSPFLSKPISALMSAFVTLPEASKSPTDKRPASERPCVALYEFKPTPSIAMVSTAPIRDAAVDARLSVDPNCPAVKKYLRSRQSLMKSHHRWWGVKTADAPTA